jgi:hypothetical protein
MRVEVKPALLRWARERAGLEPDDVARRFPRLAQWEREEVRPTVKQLERFANATRTAVDDLLLRLLPHRDGWCGEIRFGEVADGNGDVSWTRPRTLRCSTISCCLSAAFSASSRLLGLKCEATRFKKRNISATIVADVKRFGHPIKRMRFSAHTGRASC